MLKTLFPQLCCRYEGTLFQAFRQKVHNRCVLVFRRDDRELATDTKVASSFKEREKQTHSRATECW